MLIGGTCAVWSRGRLLTSLYPWTDHTFRISNSSSDSKSLSGDSMNSRRRSTDVRRMKQNQFTVVMLHSLLWITFYEACICYVFFMHYNAHMMPLKNPYHISHISWIILTVIIHYSVVYLWLWPLRIWWCITHDKQHIISTQVIMDYICCI